MATQSDHSQVAPRSDGEITQSLERHMFVIETTDDEDVRHWWTGNNWRPKSGIARTYKTESEASGVLEHLQSVAFGTKTDNAIIVNIGPKEIEETRAGG